MRSEGYAASVTGAFIGLIAGGATGVLGSSVFEGDDGLGLGNLGLLLVSLLMVLALAGVGAAVGSGLALKLTGNTRALPTAVVMVGLWLVEFALFVIDERVYALLPAAFVANGAWGRWLALRLPAPDAAPPARSTPLPPGSVRVGPPGVIGAERGSAPSSEG